MDGFSYSVPGLLFPAISLLMLAYTNRFLGLAAVTRELIDRHRERPDPGLRKQLRSLSVRLNLIRHAQGVGGTGLLFCTGSLFAMFMRDLALAQWIFGASLVLMMTSLAIGLREIYLSARAIQIELESIEAQSALI